MSSSPLLGSSGHAAVVAPLTHAARRRAARARRARSRRARERGIILIFVVVLLMLLAIMGTAYLASSRADKMALTKNGALPGTNTPRLADRARLDALFEASQRRVQNAIIEDLFNIAPGQLPKIAYDADHGVAAAKARLFASFRQSQQFALNAAGTAADVNNRNYYYNYDAPGRADPYLASLLPTHLAGNGPVVWPWISAPLRGELSPGVSTAPFFIDPRAIDPSNLYDNVTSQGFRVAPYAVQIDPNVSATVDTNVDPTSTAGKAAWTNAVNDRMNVRVTSLAMLREDSETANLTVEGSKTTRVYPAFAFQTATPHPTLIAGDADGDGIADCGLMPVIINNNASSYVDRYVDRANGVVYFVGYRVVDNSSQINMNTALTAKGDFESFVTGTGNTSIRGLLELATPDAPNLGFFRSNVGFAELLRNSLENLGTGTGSPLFNEVDRISDARFPQIKSTTNAQETAPPSSTANGTASREFALRRLSFAADANAPTVAAKTAGRFYLGLRDDPTTLSNTATAQPTEEWFFRFRSFGDLLENQLARQTDAPGQLRTGAGVVTTSGLVSLPMADTLSFAASGGTLLNPRITPDVGEKALLLSTNMFAPNYSASTNEPWRWFPPGEVATWFGWTKDFGMIAVAGATIATAPAGTNYSVDLLDDATPSARQYSFPGRSGMAAVNSLPKTIRGLLTTRSGVTNVAPKRYDSYINGSALVPSGMPDYGPDNGDGLTYPAQRVSAATGTKEALWRAYWSAMTQNSILAGSGSAGYQTEQDLYDARLPLPPTGPSSATHYYPYGDATGDAYHHAYDAFLPPDRHPSTPYPDPVIPPGTSRPQIRLSDKQMTLIRSSIAACNTIDLRDSDNDLTAMTVDLGESDEYAPASPGPDGTFGTSDDIRPKTTNSQLGTLRQEMYARVFGTEKQLVITGVVMDKGGSNTIAVEIFNPSNEPLRLDGYYIAVVDRSAAANATSTLATGVLTIDPAGPTFNGTTADPNRAHLLPAAPTPNTIAPGGFLILCNGDPTAPVGGITIASAVPKDLTTSTPKGTALEKPAGAAALAPQVIYYPNMTGLNQLATQQDRELVLLRTRRADGVAYTENALVETESDPKDMGKRRRPRMDEVIPPAAADDLGKLAPVDAVDFRSIGAGAAGRFVYLRSTTHPNYYTPSKYAWREFYAGKFFDLRRNKTVETFDGLNGTKTTAVTTGPVPPQTPGTRPTLLTEWAWHEYADPAAAGQVTLGSYREPDPAVAGNNTPGPGGPGTPPTPFYAPTIPIQNATPYTVFDTSALIDPAATPQTVPVYDPKATYTTAGATAPYVDHPPFQFPYGSPFARNLDVLNVPFIGSYTIFRVPTNGLPSIGTTQSAVTFATAKQVYEMVPLPMDAVNVAPFSAQWRRVSGSTADDLNENGSVGRFDPRLSILPRNDWAADLFDYVTARQADGTKVNFPDVPVFSRQVALPRYNDPLNPLTDQDGPVVGYNAAVVPNDRKDTTWIEWRPDATTGVTPRTGAGSFSRQPNTVSNGISDAGSQLTEGTVNLNTAPPIVLRMLPWTIDPATGLLDQSPAGVSNIEQRWRVAIVDDFLSNPAASAPMATPPVSTGRTHAALDDPPYGITSLFALSDLRRLKMSDPLDTTSTRLTTDKLVLDISDPFPAAAVPLTMNTDVQLMRLGMLNPMYRSASTSDFGLQHLNANRLSNVASQRSDVFTVYVTVQAWTYTADGPPTAVQAAQKQTLGTRLVGERRGSFVVDRSRISPDNYKPSDLLIYPVEQE